MVIDTFGDMDLSILGIKAAYPPYKLEPKALDIIAKRFYPDSPAMKKLLTINNYTGVDTRSSIGTPDHPLVNMEKPPSIAQLHEAFMEFGVPLAVDACRGALEQAGVDVSEVTHIVATTCTDSANPGFDHFLAKQLGIKHPAERVLLHGVGCSGGLAALRTGANLALGHTARGKPARVLCVALEISTSLVRSELDSLHETQEMRIAPVLFSDCGSALVLSNGIGHTEKTSMPIYDLLGWQYHVIPDTEDCLGFDADPMGWKVILRPNVPKEAAQAMPETFKNLVASIDKLPACKSKPQDFDWAVHPGGSSILTGVERALDIKPEMMRASYHVYTNHGNSSSATIFSVLEKMTYKDMDAYAPDGKPKEYMVACAFGPGMAIESCMLKRRGVSGHVGGVDTPPEDASEAAASQTEDSSYQAEEFISRALEEVDLD
ncbi:hypothetical protein BROUX41_002334 [Berkeleyomyces rouxiae]|uniref:uncharacterized protein n=1 Tax=Berkeleyomyces rouxiae TaxID=2035830 RepID=UPI003B78CD35